MLYTFDLLMLGGKDVRSWLLRSGAHPSVELRNNGPLQLDFRKDSTRFYLISSARSGSMGSKEIVAKRAGSPFFLKTAPNWPEYQRLPRRVHLVS